MIFKAIFQGLALGLALALSIGPSFFALIQTSTKKGFKPALALAFGIFLSDIFCVMLAYLGVAQFFDNPKYKPYVGVVGGTVLAMFGFFSIIQSKSMTQEKNKDMAVKAVKLPLYITKGFLLNLLNPVVIGLWMACVVSVSSNDQFSRVDVAFFFTASLLTIFVTDVLKAYSANKISDFLSPKVLRIVTVVAGIILMISGLIIIYRVFA
jgi:threonine/homoserine/homoserine lactone efflux protein